MEEQVVRLEVPVVPSSQNVRQRMHWRVRAQEDDMLAVYVQQAWARAGRPKAQGRACRIETTVRLEGRADDEDNRLARLKPIFDRLILLGALQDDSPAWCRHAIPDRTSAPRGQGSIVIVLRYVDHF